MAEMTFAWPRAFWLLLLLLPLAALLLHHHRRKRRLLEGFLSASAARAQVVRSGREIGLFKGLLLLASVALLVAALARPQWGDILEPSDVRGLEIVFLLDTSRSMLAEDLAPNRLQVAKELVSTVAGRLQSDRIALVSFAARATLQCPLTADFEAFDLLLQAVAIAPPGEQGTDFQPALALVGKSFRRATAGQRLAVLISDGEDLENRWPDEIKKLRKLGVTLFTVGVGAAAGAPIPLRDDTGRIVDWKKDAAGQMVRSRLDEATLARIAAAGGGRYVRLTDRTGIEAFARLLQDHERGVLARKVRPRRIERFSYPLGLALLLLGVEAALSERRVTWKRAA